MSDNLVLTGFAVILFFSGLLLTFYGSSKPDPNSFLKYFLRRTVREGNRKQFIFIGIACIIISMIILFFQ